MAYDTDTAKQRDEWDGSNKGKNLETLTQRVAVYIKHCDEEMVVAGEMLNKDQDLTHKTNKSTLKDLIFFARDWLTSWSWFVVPWLMISSNLRR